MYTPDSDGSILENASECLGRCGGTYDHYMGIVVIYKENSVCVALVSVRWRSCLTIKKPELRV